MLLLDPFLPHRLEAYCEPISREYVNAGGSASAVGTMNRTSRNDGSKDMVVILVRNVWSEISVLALPL
jgi:hypothetical protein